MLGQAFQDDEQALRALAEPALVGEADNLYIAYVSKLASAKSPSAPQVSQVADETMVRFDYIQIKQNQEIIRLLKQIAEK